jgi:uncharacterized protein YcbX
VDPARLRPNLVVDTDAPGLLEDAWAGREVTIGEELVLRIGYRMPRCVMVNLPQRGLPADRELLGLITALTDGGLGVVADVVRPGRVSLGDPVRVAAAG